MFKKQFPSSTNNFQNYNINQRSQTNYNNRPQTPVGNTSGHFNTQSMNRSYNKGPSYNQNYNPTNQYNRQPMSKSRVSVTSGTSQLANLGIQNQNIFPQELVFLLKNQEKNINKLKEKIELQKRKVQNDFSVFKQQIQHILEDAKLSVQAELDLYYKTFITKYAELKGQVQEIRLLRKQILMNNPINYSVQNQNANKMVSNKDLVDEIEKDAEHVRNFKIYGYLSELQKQKLQPVLQICNDLIVIGGSQCPLYKNKQMSNKLKGIKGHFKEFMSQVFDELDEYVVMPDALINREREQNENSRVLQEQFFNDTNKMKPFDLQYPTNKQQETYTTNLQKSANLKRSHHINSMPVNQPPPPPPQKSKKLTWINNNEQVGFTNWCDEVKLNRMEQIETDHTDHILCIYFVNDQYIATGSKDKTINIYNLDGKKIKNLKGHDASICCLSTVKNLNGDVFLASGSDRGCCSLILWDIRSWTIHTKIQAHLGAVTGIVDLDDGRHVITGSYDQKLNLYSLVSNKIVYSINDNKSSITGMVMTVDKSKLVTGGLDSSVTIWNIVRKHNIVEEIYNEKVVNLGELICQLQTSLLRPQIVFCATKDGNIKTLNTKTYSQKSCKVNDYSLIELLILQRELNNESPIAITCSFQDKNLTMTKLQNGYNTSIKVSGGLGIKYGCGIGPKVVMSQARDGIIAIANQTNGSRQFSIYEIELK